MTGGINLGRVSSRLNKVSQSSFSPDVSQFLLGDPEAFPVQMEYLIPPVCSESPPSWTCPEKAPQGEVLIRLPKPLKLVPSNTKKQQWFLSERLHVSITFCITLLLGDLLFIIIIICTCNCTVGYFLMAFSLCGGSSVACMKLEHRSVCVQTSRSSDSLTSVFNLFNPLLCSLCSQCFHLIFLLHDVCLEISTFLCFRWQWKTCGHRADSTPTKSSLPPLSQR